MNINRKTSAWDKRQAANQLATDRYHPRHYSNGDELKFRHEKESDIAKCHKENHRKKHINHHEDKKKDNLYVKDLAPISLEGKPSFLMSFTKGMPHDYDTGLLQNPLNFQYFIRAIDSGDPRDFRDTPLGPQAHSGSSSNCTPPQGAYKWKSDIANYGKLNPDKTKNGDEIKPVNLRAWESQSAGLAYELEGPDAHAVTMPPAPRLGSPELTAEMAEVYVQALARDIPFHALSAGLIEEQYLGDFSNDISLNGVINQDDGLEEFHTDREQVKEYIALVNQLRKLEWFSKQELKLNPAEEARRCNRMCPNPTNAFRGITKGDDIGPYISQFLLIGNNGVNIIDGERSPAVGLISYGAVNIDQRVRVASSKDYMQTWDEWFDVQNAASVGGLEQFETAEKRRFIYTPRDLATYVHYDALYEAYLNACLILLGRRAKFDPGIPFQEDDTRDHQQGFAHFGGPHILSLVTEVATRALKAVRYQKYNIHRRCRPEVLAARISKYKIFDKMAPKLKDVVQDLGDNKNEILDRIKNKNSADQGEENFLLPMAFTEGSPMHPAYGAGHATVAGACITILKAFFDCTAVLKVDGKVSNKAYVSVDDGKELKLIPVMDREGKDAHLTIEGELNKLASNISIGRNWAGVHYFSDYYESLLMGEQIAIGILEEQKLMFGENFSMSIPMFNGNTLRI